MHLHWPQLVVIALCLLSAGFNLAKHGEPQTGRHNFFVEVVGSILLLLVLKAGGFFG